MKRSLSSSAFRSLAQLLGGLRPVFPAFPALSDFSPNATPAAPSKAKASKFRISMASQKRTALKKRNRARHKARC